MIQFDLNCPFECSVVLVCISNKVNHAFNMTLRTIHRDSNIACRKAQLSLGKVKGEYVYKYNNCSNRSSSRCYWWISVYNKGKLIIKKISAGQAFSFICKLEFTKDPFQYIIIMIN